MNPRALTRRQYFALCALVMLSPALRLLPQANTELAGSASWLCGLAAFPPLLLLALLLGAMLRRRREGEGMGDLMLRALGPVAGKIVLALYALWFLLYAAFLLRSSAERFIATVYPYSRPWAFVAVLLLISLLAALGGPKALFRAAEIFSPLMTLTLVFVLLFALPELNWENLLPVSARDVLPVLRGALPIVNIGAGLLVYPTFFEGMVPQQSGRNMAAAKWLVRLCALSTLLSAVVIGSFGAELTQKLSHPFFTLLRNLSIFHAVERFEALVVGLWVLPDFVLVSLMLTLASGGLRTAVGKPPQRDDGSRLPDLKNRRALIWLCALAALAGGLLLAPDSFQLTFWSKQLIPWGTLALTAGGIPLIFAIGLLRKKL